MDWDAWEEQTGQKRPAWIDGIGNVNYSYDPTGGGDQSRPLSDGERRALSGMPQVSQNDLRPGLMPQPAMPQMWRPEGPGLAWIQAGANLRPR